jgi:hypothetical protein
VRLSWEQVRAWRLRRQHLDVRAGAGEALAVASRLCGLHAQVLSSAELTLWARVDGLEPGAVERMLWADRTLVKQWAMRGTLHLLPTAELGLWHAALGTYDHFRRPSWSKAFGITQEELEVVIAAADAVLDDRLLTRTELADALAAHLGRPALAEALAGSWGSVLKPLAFAGKLCFGPGEGRNVRFTHPRTWAGATTGPDGPAALVEVAHRFVSAYGPATREDFARWWATTPARAGRLLAGRQDALEVDVEGTPMWMTAAGAAEAGALAPPAGVRLLPGFDQYVIGSTAHAERVIAGPHRSRVHRPQGWVSPVLLVGGRVEGVWRHERRGRRLRVTVEPFGRMGREVRAEAEEEVGGLATFLGGDLDLSWGP